MRKLFIFFLLNFIYFTNVYSQSNDTIISCVIFVNEKLCLKLFNEELIIKNTTTKQIDTCHNVEYRAGILIFPKEYIPIIYDTNYSVKFIFLSPMTSTYHQDYSFDLNSLFLYSIIRDGPGYNVVNIYDFRIKKYKRRFKITDDKEEYAVEIINSNLRTLIPQKKPIITFSKYWFLPTYLRPH